VPVPKSNLENFSIMIDDTMVVIRSYNTITEAEIAKSVLASGGIRAEIRNEYMSTLYPVGVMPAQIVVRSEDEQAARDLLAVR
jgi:hypothetical protein